MINAKDRLWQLYGQPRVGVSGGLGVAATRQQLVCVCVLVCKKGKEVCVYSAILSSISKRSDMDHTVLPANYTMSS